MPLWARYAITVYVGLMMAGSLPSFGWADASPKPGRVALVKSTQFAPLKKPYRFPDQADSIQAKAE